MNRRDLLERAATTGLWIAGVGSASATTASVDRPSRSEYGTLLQTMDGNGTDGDPYAVTDVAELQAIAEEPDARYVLEADVDASATADWNDGSGFEPIEEFGGTLDGRGHAVTGLTIARDGRDVTGIFGALLGAVRNLRLAGVEVAGGNRVGALAGRSFTATVENVTVGGSVRGSEDVGGLVGRFEASTGDSIGASVESCTSGCDVTGETVVGGLLGIARGGARAVAEVTDCAASGTVAGEARVGGLAGETEGIFGGQGVVVENCEASATVTTREDVGGVLGGLIGVADDSRVRGCHASGSVGAPEAGTVGGLLGEARDPDAFVVASYATGPATGDERVGGLAGHHVYGEISRCYATGDVTGNKYVGGIAGEMREARLVDVYTHSDVTTRVSNCTADDVDECNGPTGGLVGSLENTFGGDAAIERTLATGAVEGPYSNGLAGVVGSLDEETSVEAAYWDDESTGRSRGIMASEGNDSPISIEEYGVQTSDLRGTAAESTLAEFDFEEVWRTTADGYPDLRAFGAGEVERGCSIAPSDLELDPYPVETGDRPGLSVVLSDAEDVTLLASYDDADGETVDVERSLQVAEDTGDGRRWETERDLPAVDRMGTWVDLTVEITTEDDACTVTELDGRHLDETSDLGYYTFDHVLSAAVLPATFADETPPTGDDRRQLDRWLDAREIDTNRFFGSERGSMGVVGFDFTLEKNDGGADGFYEVSNRKDQYRGGRVARNLVDGPFETFLDDLEGAASDVSFDAYDFWIGTHAGEEFQVGRAVEGAVTETDGRMYAPHLLETDAEYTAWPHELGHRYGLAHTYTRGLNEYLGAMGSGSRDAEAVRALAPFTTPLRIADSLGFTFGSFDNEYFQDWLTPARTDLLDQRSVERTIPSLHSYEYGDETPVLEAGSVSYVLESRPYLGVEADGGDLQWESERGAAVVYRHTDPGVGAGTITIPKERGEDGSRGILTATGDSVRDMLAPANPGAVTVELVDSGDSDASPAEFETRVSVGYEPGGEDERVVAVADRIETPDELDVPAADGHGGLTPPSLDLRAADDQGRVVGVDEGTYRTEIPGARASGKRVRGMEWIAVPADADVEFTVSSADVEQYVQDLRAAGYVVPDGAGDGDERLTVGELRDRMTVGYRASETRYDEDPQLVGDEGEGRVDGASVTVHDGGIEPGSEADPTPSNPDGDLAVVAIDHDASLGSEAITFGNEGDGNLAVGGWRLETRAGPSYTFPEGTVIADGAELTLHSREGDDGGEDLFWGADGPVWSDGGGALRVTDGDATRLSVRYDERGGVYYETWTNGGPMAPLTATGVGFGAVGLGAVYLAYRVLSADYGESDGTA